MSRIPEIIPKIDSYLTQQEIESEYEAKYSRFDLFDRLIKAVDEEEAYALAHPKIQHMQRQAAAQQHMMDEQKVQQHHGCRCSKIGCLKLYCECFASGKKCGGSCQCTCCHNKQGNQEQIYQAKMLANFRHPGHFKGIPALTPTRRCTCKKSMCQKKYCQCYSAGLKCTQFCECKDCQNGHPHSHEEEPYMNLDQHAMQVQVQA